MQHGKYNLDDFGKAKNKDSARDMSEKDLDNIVKKAQDKKQQIYNILFLFFEMNLKFKSTPIFVILLIGVLLNTATSFGEVPECGFDEKFDPNSGTCASKPKYEIPVSCDTPGAIFLKDGTCIETPPCLHEIPVYMTSAIILLFLPPIVVGGILITYHFKRYDKKILIGTNMAIGLYVLLSVLELIPIIEFC